MHLTMVKDYINQEGVRIKLCTKLIIEFQKVLQSKHWNICTAIGKTQSWWEAAV